MQLVAAIAVAAVPLLPVAALAEDSQSIKAQVEHDERVAATAGPTTVDHATKAQIEHVEAAAAPRSPTVVGEQAAPQRPSGAAGGAAGWQLALSAAAGAAATGVVVAAGRRTRRGPAALAG
jgi:hypothetical protein